MKTPISMRQACTKPGAALLGVLRDPLFLAVCALLTVELQPGLGFGALSTHD
jgi:hypothetical protein